MESRTAIADQIVMTMAYQNILPRLSDPFWFHAYGSVMGWTGTLQGSPLLYSVHSSVESTIAFQNLGLPSAGAGRYSVRTPANVIDNLMSGWTCDR
jgi:hypothetical protein